MKNYKIRKKLLVSFGSIGILILIMCAIALYCIVMSKIRMQALYNDNLIGSGAVGRMREIYQHERALIREAFLAPTEIPWRYHSIKLFTI